MRPQLLSVLTIMACLVLLTGCEEEQTPAQPASKPAAKVAVAPAGQSQPAEAVAAPPAAKFVYRLDGRRDPFVPLIATKATIGDFENPLEAFDLPQFTVKAVIIGMGETKAMVTAPDGKAYILKKGMRLGKANGVILEITQKRVLVEEQYQDMTGKIRKNLQELIVPVREGV